VATVVDQLQQQYDLDLSPPPPAWGWRRGGAELATGASDPLHGSEKGGPWSGATSSIATGAAVLARQARFDTEMAAINMILDRIDERISKLEAKPWAAFHPSLMPPQKLVPLFERKGAIFWLAG
jgi:hypothetical protein